MTPPAQLTILPANEASCADLAEIFGTRGEAAICWCQRYKLAPREAFKHFPPEIRAERLRRQTHCGHPESATTSGLVAYLLQPDERSGLGVSGSGNDGPLPQSRTPKPQSPMEPVGWCAVEPRTAYAGLLRVYRVPWLGRAEDKADAGIWAVTCLFTRAGYRQRGVSHALARAAVDFARARGARALEAYPMITEPGQEIPWGELHVGSQSTFAAGFKEITRPTPRRAVMRIDFW